MSTSTRHVSKKSPLLLQFPYCELCDNDNKQSNYRLMNVLFCTRALKVWKHSRQFASVGWQAVNQIDWYFRRTFTKDVIICVQTLRVIGLIPSQWELHTFYLFEAISLLKTKKNRGSGLSHPGKKQKQKPLCLFEFWGRPFKLAKFHWSRWDGM